METVKKVGVGSLLVAALLLAGCAIEVDQPPDPGLGSALGHPSKPPGSQDPQGGGGGGQNPNASGSGAAKIVTPADDIAGTAASAGGTSPDPVPWDHGPHGHKASPGMTPGLQ
jgi:hypothetical protein